MPDGLQSKPLSGPQDFTPDQFVSGLGERSSSASAPGSGAPPKADDFSPDDFVKTLQPSAGTVHPALAGLPQPHEAVANAELKANDVADMLTRVGQQMRADALSKAHIGTPETNTPQAPTNAVPGGMALSVPVIPPEGANPVHGVQSVAQGVEQAAEPGLPSKAGGASKIIRGGMEAATPLAPFAIAGAPLETLAGLGAGALAQAGTEKGLEKAGVRPEYAGLAGDVAGLGAGALGAHFAGKFGPQPGLNPEVAGSERAPMERQIEAPPEAPTASEASRATVDLTPDQYMAEKGNAPKSATKQPSAETEAPLKPLHEMNPDELDQVIQQRSQEEKSLLSTLFGEEGAKRYSRLERAANNSWDTKKADAASAELSKMEEALSPAQRNKLFGIDQPEEHDLDQAKGMRGALGRLDASSPEALGDSLKWALSRFDPEHPTANPEAYAQLRHGVELARENGFDTAAVSQAAVKGAAGRFSDPEDAAFILSKFARQQSAGATQPAGAKAVESEAPLPERAPKTAPIYGKPVSVNVAGENSSYPGVYAVRDLSDIQPSHNPQSFEKNPHYDYENDRDYSNPENAARVIHYSAKGQYDPAYPLTPSPTAEQGAPIIDQRGNVLGGNNRTMSLARVYTANPEGADAYRQQLADNAQSFGIDPAELGRFKNPVLVRELQGRPTASQAQRAITDFNKTAAAKLAPEEQAVADGRRLSPRTLSDIAGNLDYSGEDSTLSQALKGENGPAIINGLVHDGVLTAQERNGYIDDRGLLTGAAKDRIGKALVGRLFDSASDFSETPVGTRNTLERIAPQVLRVEDRPDWALTVPVREAVGALADAKAHGIKNLDDLAKQGGLNAGTAFETSRGSRYTWSGSSTARVKAATGESFSASDRTVYITPEVDRRLMETLQANAIDKSIRSSIRDVNGQISLVVKDAKTGAIRNDLSKSIAYAETPKVGLHPVEIWNKNAKTGEYGFHLGHAITKVESAGKVGSTTSYSPDALAIAKKLQESPTAAQKAFRQYANDSQLSREGSQVGFFEPPTRAEAFSAAFGASDFSPHEYMRARDRANATNATPTKEVGNDNRTDISVGRGINAQEQAKGLKEKVQSNGRAVEQPGPRSGTPSGPRGSAHEVGKVGQKAEGGQENQEALAARRLKAVDPNAGRETLMRQGDALFVPGRNPGEGKVYVNSVAMTQIMQLDAVAKGRDPAGAQIPEGVAMQSGSVGGILNEIRKRLTDERLPLEYRAALGHIGQELAKSTSDHSVTVLVPNTPGHSLDQTKGIIRQELIHREQFGLQSSGRIRGHVDAGKLFEHPALSYGEAMLEKTYGGDREILAAEVPAWLGAGQYKELGLSRQEALSGLQHYFDLLFARYGAKTFSVLAKVQPDLRKELYDHYRRKQRAGHNPGSASGDLGSAGGSPSRERGDDFRSSVSRRSGESPNRGPVSLRRSGAVAEGAQPPRPAGERLPERRQAGSLGEVQRNVPGEEVSGQRRGSAAEGVHAGDRTLNRGNDGGARGRDHVPDGTDTFGRVASTERRPGREPGAPDRTGEDALFSRASDENEGKVNYSGLGALEDITTRNLSQLRRADTPATMAAIRAAASRSEASALLKTAVPQIEKALAGEHTFEDFRRGLIESRLQGIEQRWNHMADFARRASDANLASSQERILPLLGHIEDRAGFGRNLADTASSLLEKKDYGSLRELLAETFGSAANAVAHIMPEADFQALRYSPNFQDALKIYKRLVEKPMAQSHESNEGVFSDALGPLDTYYPLVPVAAEGKAHVTSGSKLQYSRPKNTANNFATGLAEDYDAGMEAFRDRLTKAVRANNKAALMDTLKEQRLVQPLKPFERGAETIVYRGQNYEAVRMETTPGRQVIQNGKSTFVPPSTVMVPKWLHKELEPILQGRSKPTLGSVRRIFDLTNQIAISGPADFVWHSSNLFGTLVANTPFLGNSLVGKAASAPVLKRFTAIVKVLATDPTTEESAADLQEMAKLGMLPDRFGSETYSRKYAEQTGAELKRYTMGPMLYGPKGIDVRARLVMYRLAKEINPGAGGPELHLFVNQLGNYVDALQGQIERQAKHIGLSPFATAGTTMLRNGINAWTGTGAMPKSGIGLRIWQQLTGGAVGLVALWALSQKAYTGKWPWEDKRSKLLQIPVNKTDRYSKLGRALWGNGAETGYINFTMFNPLVGRGARALGIKGAADTAYLGGKWWQMLEAAQKDMMNAYAHPWLGPIPRAAFVGLTGDEPYLTGLRDDRARFEPQFTPAVRKAGEGTSIAKRVGAAAKELNSFYGNVAANSGLGDANPHDSTNHWQRMIFDLALPGLIANPQNPAAQRVRVIRQAAAAKRQR